ncbi:thioesterase II family protein [Streptomyces sp. NPDC008122]|uniref:thioesterase II family protein n=1 Tax=Streptomyces sp. NPDC008122 TaxID=3364810 RepID=UPI0036E14E6B
MTIEDLPTRARWLRTFRRVARPRRRLVCAPHAGGTAQAYRGWPAGRPADVEVHDVQYPGRQDRLGEPAPASTDDLIGPVFCPTPQEGCSVLAPCACGGVELWVGGRFR